MFVTVNGYGYQRFDWPNIVKDVDARKKRNEGAVPVTEEEIEAAEFQAFEKELTQQKKTRALRLWRIQPFWESLNEADRATFEDWYAEQTAQNIDALITVPESESPRLLRSIALSNVMRCFRSGLITQNPDSRVSPKISSYGLQERLGSRALRCDL